MGGLEESLKGFLFFDRVIFIFVGGYDGRGVKEGVGYKCIFGTDEEDVGVDGAGVIGTV